MNSEMSSQVAGGKRRGLTFSATAVAWGRRLTRVFRLGPRMSLCLQQVLVAFSPQSPESTKSLLASQAAWLLLHSYIKCGET